MRGKLTLEDFRSPDGAEILAGVVAPLFTVVAAALKAEGYRFRVLTPAGTVRLAAESSADDYIEVAIDTLRDPPGLVGRVSRRWGRRVLVEHLGFEERVRASHHVYRKAGVAEKVNLQRDGGNAKPYQVRQVRRLILKYRLGREG